MSYWSIASGHNINIWEDPWIPGIPTYKVFKNIIRSPKKKSSFAN